MSGALVLRGAVVGVLSVAVGLLVSVVAATSGEPAWAWVAEAAAALVAGAVGGYLTFRNSSRALADVARAAEQIGAGELGRRVGLAGGPAEELTRTFNTMARRLQDLLDRLAAEQARLEALFDASADATIALGGDQTVRFLNAAACRLFATSAAAALDRPLIETARDYELEALVRRAAARGGHGESQTVTFGAARVPLRATALPIPGGGDWAILLTLSDLTEVNRVDQMRRDFLSNVSHELRTPLASVRALVETMEAGAVAPGAETQDFLARVRQQVDRLTTLVNELLDLSRIESGALVLHPEALDLAAVFDEAASLLGARAKECAVEVERPTGPGPVVEADRAAMLRAVSNLLDNAIRYSPPGGTVRVALQETEELGTIAVSDEGPGIPGPQQQRVFERFFKGDDSRAEAGVGLGLAIVKHLVRAHGGTASVESAPGEGATFRIAVPKRFVGPRPPLSR
ncbi:MAG: PAS domain-containing protein [Dehalococcoidia bacterium]|nr:PAS domain-containing protein [Dehalococcoidia bacterium]